jgi:hypothetical protein
MGRTLAPVDLRVIGDVLTISRSPWFEPDDSPALAFYLMHHYSPGPRLRVVAEPFAREWFKIGQGRFDALASYAKQATTTS